MAPKAMVSLNRHVQAEHHIKHLRLCIQQTWLNFSQFALADSKEGNISCSLH